MAISNTNRALLLLGFLAACGDVSAPRAVAGTPAPRDLGDIDPPAADVDPRASEFLVWTRDEEGRAETHRIDASGDELEAIDGVLVATSTGTWRWREQDRTVLTVPCERYDDEGALLTAPEPEPGSATRVTLENTASGSEQVLVEPPAGSDGAEDFRHAVELVASVGPWLFVRESTYVYTCGAHGTMGVEAMIWDASNGSMAPFPRDLGSLEKPRDAAMQLLAADGDGFPPTEDTTELTEMVPSFGADGSLRIGLQFTSTTCYACTRGNGGSYTKSEISDAERAPAMLSAFADTPRAVRVFAVAHPTARLKGWSAVK